MVLHNTTTAEVKIDLSALNYGDVKGLSVNASYFNKLAAAAGWLAARRKRAAGAAGRAAGRLAAA